jgi:hypothetical protein
MDSNGAWTPPPATSARNGDAIGGAPAVQAGPVHRIASRAGLRAGWATQQGLADWIFLDDSGWAIHELPGGQYDIWWNDRRYGQRYTLEDAQELAEGAQDRGGRRLAARHISPRTGGMTSLVQAPGDSVGDSEIVAYHRSQDGTRWCWALDRATGQPRTLRYVPTAGAWEAV